MYTKAVVRTPCERLVDGLTCANLGIPDYKKAMVQHLDYIEVLKSCGLEVKVMDADNLFPDSVFVEDTAVLTAECAIITNPGALSRRGETTAVRQTLDFYPELDEIKTPGTLDAGDVMRVDNHYYIGLSERTNIVGAHQLIDILKSHDLDGSMIDVGDILHLKTGVAYLENDTLLVTKEMSKVPEFSRFNQLQVDDNEVYAANCVWINNRIVMAKGFPMTQELLIDAGYSIMEVDVSEFRKLDGGISCLSLRF